MLSPRAWPRLLVFAGAGAIVADAAYDGVLGGVGIALVFGLVIMVMVYATGHLSGAHINPAVTLAFTFTRHFPPRDAVAYIAAQIAGAAVAALTLLVLWPDQPGELGATVPSVAAWRALIYEVVLTTFLMFAIMAVATDVARRRRRGSHRHRWNRRPRRAVRRSRDRGVDESSSVIRPSDRLGDVGGLLDLPRRTAHGGDARSVRVSTHSRGSPRRPTCRRGGARWPESCSCAYTTRGALR